MSHKEELMEEMKEIVEKLLAEKGEEVSLSDIEQAVMAVGQQIEAKLTEHLVAANEKKSQKPTTCAQCGEKLRYKGHRKKELVTRTGEISVKRAYYYCKK